MLKQLSLRKKLWLSSGFSLIALLFLSVWDIHQTRDLQLAERRRALIDVTEMAYTIVAGFGRLEDQGKLTREEAQLGAIARVRDQRFTGDGYVSILRSDSVVVMHPINPKLEGKNMIEFKDAKGNSLYKMIAFAGGSSGGGGFIEYWWPRPGSEKSSAKIGFVKHFKPWDWDIVCSMYSDDIEADFRQALIHTIVVFAGIAAFLTLIVGMVTRNIILSVGGEPEEAANAARKIAAGRFDRLFPGCGR
ncbi:signal transduction histidine kinase [Herbaspirillum sp. 1130]|nr:signal transduction histidine kinase [Herbaspirillum sp. 1130]